MTAGRLRRHRGLLLALLLPAAAACSRREAGSPSPSPSGLDVVLVTIDTLRADAPGFAGNGGVKTPVMDRLAASGRVFSNAHAHNVVTLPSHANILTGLLPFTHGVRDNAGTKLDAKIPTLAARLKPFGYTSGAFVAAFPLDARFGLGNGFDIYDDQYGKGGESLSFILPERPGRAVISAALDWWVRQTPGKRFLWVHLFEPHAPYAPPPPFDAEYREHPYWGEVAAADAALAPLVDPVLAGSAPPTLVILTGDHGEALGEHGEETHGLFAYEATLHVPLVLFGPGILVTPGVDRRLAGHVDIVPTVLEAVGAAGASRAGTPAPEAYPLAGRSLLKPDDLPAPLSYFEALSAELNRGWAPLTGLIRGNLKYVDLPIRELYDLEKDPKETTNLAARHDDRVRDLKRAMPAESSRPATRSAPTAEEIAKLRSLGYVATRGARSGTGKSYTEEDDPKRLVTVDQELHRIIDLYQRHRLGEAISAAEAVVRARPKLTVAAEHLAFLYQQADRLTDAARLLRPVVAKGAAEPVRVRLGMVLSEMGRAGEAVKVLSPLESSDDPDTLNALGIALADSKQYGKARSVFARALSLDPSNPAAHQNLGIVAMREAKLQEARASFEKALALNPSLPVALNGLGAALAQLGEIDGALQAWGRLVALAPGDLDALYNLGMTAMKSGRKEVGAEALSRFAKAAPPGRYGKEIAEARRLLGPRGE